MTMVLTQALLLTSWVRNGFYLEPLAQHHISIQHVQYAEDQASPTHCCAVSSCSMPACCRNRPDADAATLQHVHAVTDHQGLQPLICPCVQGLSLKRKEGSKPETSTPEAVVLRLRLQTGRVRVHPLSVGMELCRLLRIGRQ